MNLQKALEENGKAVHGNLYDKTNLTPREFRLEQEFEFDHFIELTSTGIKPNYINIELFAHEYHRAKLNLLGTL